MLSHWGLILGILFLGILVSLMEGLGIGLLLPVMEGVKGLGDFHAPVFFNALIGMFANLSLVVKIQIVALLLLAVTAARETSLFLKNIYVARLQAVISRHFQMECLKQLLRLDMGYINSRKAGDLHAIVYFHAWNVSMSMARVGAIIHLPFTIIVLLIVLFSLSWKIAGVSVFLAVLLALAIRVILKKADNASRRLGEAINVRSSALLEIITGIKVIHLFKRENSFIDKFSRVVDDYNEVTFNIAKVTGMVSPFTQFLGVGILVLIMVTALYLFPQEGSIQVLLIFIITFTRLINPVVGINQDRVKFAGDLPYYREIFRFLEEKKHISSGKAVFTGLKNSIEMKAVDFTYSSRPDRILNEVSFVVKRGSKVGLVGPSGAGKSTIAELLLRFYDPQNGLIMVDGVDLRDLDITSWRKHIGVVSQDVYLFNDTVRSNIAFANPEAGEEEIRDAAIKAHAHAFIAALPRGYDTIVGDRGVLLSGGQKQRIAIARAILGNPEILVFDEATSALDTESEKIVQKALNEVSCGRTVISIAHRISTISDSDKIIVMDAGYIAEEGTHQQLIGRGGLYSKLVKMQELEGEVQEQEAELKVREGIREIL